MVVLLRMYNNFTLSKASSRSTFMKDNPSLFYFGARQFVIAVGGEDSDSSCRNETSSNSSSVSESGSFEKSTMEETNLDGTGNNKETKQQLCRQYE